MSSTQLNGAFVFFFANNETLCDQIFIVTKLLYGFATACSQEEVNKVMDLAKTAQKSWAKTPLWKRAELLHKAAAILKEHKAPIAECLVKEIAKPAKDSVTEVSILF